MPQPEKGLKHGKLNPPVPDDSGWPLAVSGASVNDSQAEPIARFMGSEAEIVYPGSEVVREPAFGSRYKVIREIGSGGMGMVYEAFDSLCRRKVAIKIGKPGLTQREKSRLRVEAMAVAQVSHPHICPIYDMVESGETPFLVMRLIEGEGLNRRFGRNKLRMDQRQACLLVRKVALAMHEVHLRGVVHRDLKPGNIMLEGGEPIIMDFGLARLDPSNRTDSNLGISIQGNPIGTRHYMPPEQVRGNSSEMGPRSDVYSLGVVLYEMLTSTLPFNGSDSELFRLICEEVPEPPSRRIPSGIIDSELDCIVLRCLEKRPSNRFGSMLDLASRLHEWMSRSDGAEMDLESTVVPDHPDIAGQPARDYAPLLLKLVNTKVAYCPEPGQTKIELGRQRRVSNQPSEPGNDLVVRMANDTQLSINISRLHLEINQGTRGEWFLVDKSTRGTMLNGARVLGQQPCLLKHGDRIGIAGLVEWEVCFVPGGTFQRDQISQIEQTLAGKTVVVDLGCSRGSLGTIG